MQDSTTRIEIRRIHTTRSSVTLTHSVIRSRSRNGKRCVHKKEHTLTMPRSEYESFRRICGDGRLLC
jgi:hypothetical protein